MKKIKKKIVFLLFFLLFHLSSFSQTAGNEWINYNQQYFHFPIAETGIYRIDFETINNHLINLGVSINNIPHDNFQVFGKEKEVSLLVKDNNNNGFLDSLEYIEFYAEKNDGWLDSLVYDSAHFMPDHYYSLFNDTIRYYFSWNNSSNNKRTIIEIDTNYNFYSLINYCWKTQVLKFNSNYLVGYQIEGISSPKYEIAEGWAGATLQKNSSNIEQISSLNSVGSGPNAFGQINLFSANSSTTNSNGDNHNTKLFINNNLVFDSSYFNYQTLHVKYSFSSNTISNSTDFKHEISDIGQGTDYQNIASISLSYPHTTDFSSLRKITFWSTIFINQKQRLSISNTLNALGSPILYILDDVHKIIPLVSNNSILEGVIPIAQTDSIICYLLTDSNVNYIDKIQAVNNQGYFNDFNSLQIDSAFVVITNKNLLSSSRVYAAYRATNVDTLVVDIEELYHQFSAGIFKNPLAIKRFLKFSMANWPSWPSHIFLIGKSVRFNNETTPGSRNDTISYKLNLVPSWGYPSSDNHFAVGLESNKRGYSLPIGRLSVNNNTSVLNYLNKVIELESQQGNNSNYTIENKAWQKNIAHFSGGSDSSEQAYMNNYLEQFQNIIEDTCSAAELKSLGKILLAQL